MKQLHVIVPDEIDELLKKQSYNERRTVSDIVRLALEEYLQRAGFKVERIEVQRGGDRRQSDE